MHLQLADLAPDVWLDLGRGWGEAVATAELGFPVSALALMHPEERSAVVQGRRKLARGYQRVGRPRWGQRLLCHG